MSKKRKGDFDLPADTGDGEAEFVQTEQLGVGDPASGFLGDTTGEPDAKESPQSVDVGMPPSPTLTASDVVRYMARTAPIDRDRRLQILARSNRDVAWLLGEFNSLKAKTATPTQ